VSGKLEVTSTAVRGQSELERLCGIPSAKLSLGASLPGTSLLLQPGGFVGMPVLLCAGGGKRGAWTRAASRSTSTSTGTGTAAVSSTATTAEPTPCSSVSSNSSSAATVVAAAAAAGPGTGVGPRSGSMRVSGGSVHSNHCYTSYASHQRHTLRPGSVQVSSKAYTSELPETLLHTSTVCTTACTSSTAAAAHTCSACATLSFTARRHH
jgi:hypothetical protein